MRIHPAIVAQAAATSAVLLDGRFVLGVGSGEALNEHILGDRWPPAAIRQHMLEEAVEVMRAMFTGELVNHHGEHYTVEHARLYTVPERPPPIYISAFRPGSADLAGRAGDGMISTMPAPDLLRAFRDAGGAGKPTQAGLKVCYDTDAAAARATAHRLWANEQLPGELAQTLPYPEDFQQASTLVTEDMVADAVVCGDDVDAHVRAVSTYLDAGYDEVYVAQIGPRKQEFFDFYRDQVLPRLRN